VNGRSLLLSLLAGLLLGGCATTPPQSTDPEVAAAAKRGYKAFWLGRYDLAAGFYRDALTRARMLNDRIAVGDNAYNLAAILAEAGNPTEARAVLSETRIEFDRNSEAFVEASLLEARLARQQGQTAEAQKIADEILALHPRGPRASVLIAQAHLLKAVLYCDAKDAVHARAEHRKIGRTTGALRAEADGVDGRVLLLENAPAQASAAFDRAADGYGKARRPHDVADSLVAAAAACEAANLSTAAAERYYRAARSLFAQNALPAALQQVDAAFRSADKANDPVWKDLTQKLFEEIKLVADATASEAGAAATKQE
jgi:tetratricopeptide (TPR) repeat protein